MKLGFVGLGKMGGNMAERLLNDGHEVVVYNLTRPEIETAVSKGAEGSDSLSDLISKLPERKIVWLMVPSGGPVDENINGLKSLMKSGDIIIDGGNSYWKRTRERGEELAAIGINFIDCGTSGGVWGLKNGYSLMTGGSKEAVEYIYPVFKSLAPEGGYTYCGESGAGHYVKMVHNGIEYGMMQAYAEGFEIIKTSPYNIDVEKVASGWMHGSVVQSWLLELAVKAFREDPGLGSIKGYVEDSGEGRWTVEAAIEQNVPAHVITTSLFTRFESRQQDSFAMKVLAALRNQFGGHRVIKDK
ncbi:MAG TPA: decarboxylating 6-phosphogluconate dehydrogenase [Ignavibacteria bacterium]|nr:decarboxylating 6-phosphogluconate dehydrogenase [Bacteroidota bacterium]HRE12508.1 decarboxylating 6-phosphogluconate dehydrogenase [Ignavibacteria bacterium]HRF67315.1 decarboxylating 6-phosphogluconate dehydrogenase [Ignavibacteria bacterium]HRJ05616.1 decarboxylating 6-phosphogluconate dehydrogenase [Ignavibacteria bacterium]HRJ86678.1 decarboxylating 6-phosphogluconate dehydrogenase [Ignavibacteria bacterium]